jgi:hypothetical protein
MQLFVAAIMASLSEEVAAKDREIVSLREHIAELVAAREAEPTVTPPATQPSAIDAVLALIDDPARWPTTGRALITATDAFKADTVPATGAEAKRTRVWWWPWAS